MFDPNKEVEINFLIDDLNDLVQIHFELLVGYRAALNLMRNAQTKIMIEKFINGHSIHIGSLSLMVRRYGGESRSGGEFGRAAAKMRAAAGQGWGIYTLMRKHEKKLALEYERSIRALSAVPGLETVLAENYTAGVKRISVIESFLGEAQSKKIEEGVG